MEQDEMMLRFQQLTSSKQVRVLAAFGFNLTIVARDTYVTGELGVHAPERLRAINEIQHRVLSQIFALTAEDKMRYPDDVLVSILLDHTDEYLRAQALWALDDALNRQGA